MATFNGQPVTQRGGADAGRGDDAHGVTAPNPRLTTEMGTRFQRSYKYGLGVVTTGDDGSEEFKHVGLSDNPFVGDSFKKMTKVGRPEGMGTYVYTENNA